MMMIIMLMMMVMMTLITYYICRRRAPTAFVSAELRCPLHTADQHLQRVGLSLAHHDILPLFLPPSCHDFTMDYEGICVCLYANVSVCMRLYVWVFHLLITIYFLFFFLLLVTILQWITKAHSMCLCASARVSVCQCVIVFV